MFELSVVNALLVLAAWCTICYVAIARYAAIQRLLAIGLQRGLLRCCALGPDAKPLRVVATPSGVAACDFNLPCLGYVLDMQNIFA